MISTLGRLQNDRRFCTSCFFPVASLNHAFSPLSTSGAQWWSKQSNSVTTAFGGLAGGMDTFRMQKGSGLVLNATGFAAVVVCIVCIVCIVCNGSMMETCTP